MDYPRQRQRMVERQLRRRGIEDERVLAAMGEVPRELFVPEDSRAHAYDDGAQSIGHEQTISQPWVVAAICQALELTGAEEVLEVGAGSGYSAAVLSRLAKTVVAVERIGALADGARAALAAAGAANVEVIQGDCSAGLQGRGRFSAIAVHAAAPAPPEGLLTQLEPGGRLVVPIASGSGELLTVFRRSTDGRTADAEVIAPVRFVPLIGDEGY